MGGAEQLSLQNRVRRRSGLSVRKVGDELFVLDLNSQRLHRVAGVGVRIWELLDPTRRLQDIVTILQQEYDVSAEQIAEDCLDFVGRLLDESLVVLEV